MKRIRMTSLALAVAMTAGCSSTVLSGTYRPTAENVSELGEVEEVASGGQWLFFWGLLDSGTTDLREDMGKGLKGYESLVNIEVQNKLSVGGFFLWLFTAGIVSHHNINVRAQTALSERTTPPPTAPVAPR
jgi:hypothetical protein